MTDSKCYCWSTEGCGIISCCTK